MQELLKALNSVGFEKDSVMAAIAMVESGKPVFVYCSFWNTSFQNWDSYFEEGKPDYQERVWEATSFPDFYSMASLEVIRSHVSYWEEFHISEDRIKTTLREEYCENPKTWVFWPHVESILGEGNWYVSATGSIGIYDRKVVDRNLKVLEELQSLGIPRGGKSVRNLMASGYSVDVAIHFAA